MANSISAALILGIHNHFFRGVAQPASGTLYLALHLADPLGSPAGAEVSTGNYTRLAITFGALSSNQASNSNELQWVVSGASYGLVTHIALWTAATAGSLLAGAPLPLAREFGAGDVVTVPAGQIILSYQPA